MSVCVAYLRNRGIIDFGPSQITVCDFAEPIVGAITRFADTARPRAAARERDKSGNVIAVSRAGSVELAYPLPTEFRHDLCLQVERHAVRAVAETDSWLLAAKIKQEPRSGFDGKTTDGR